MGCDTLQLCLARILGDGGDAMHMFSHLAGVRYGFALASESSNLDHVTLSSCLQATHPLSHATPGSALQPVMCQVSYQSHKHRYYCHAINTHTEGWEVAEG